MDSLTQIVLGAAVGEAVLGKKVGNRAMFYGAIAGTIPDLDVISSFFVDTVTALEVHRGFTHSILFSILFAPIFGFIIAKIDSYKSFKGWTLLFFWGFFTHPILDAHTTWGTQLFWPFDIRLAFKTIFVIDPLYTLPFLTFLILAMFQKKDSPKRQFYNRTGLIVSSSYLALTFLLKGLAFVQFTNALEQQKISYQEIETKPAPMNTVLWSANVKRENDFLIGSYSFFDQSEITYSSYPKNHELIGHLMDNEKMRRMIHISKGWFTITQKEEELFYNDLRFGLLSTKENANNFVFQYKIIENNDGTINFVETKKEIADGKQLLIELWDRVKGN
ncbi:metal-dependent hydrolase [Brumimicrobium salinarum]|uniref:Metal-dependent hydrolase n=1 Tax=Brumimicrobium salinarum TaxID=2058658 RepID=A0A2I0R0X6_9FLAO|nr:metal-dependent hydrolase [Brumimicrobium salinarum]PKR80224.1 metal-dependent hydrolase [Brumimicrobium salinarum]